ncbi:hypothetical protein [Synechococcus sp. CCFWC 502]|uniref:hypothetical protein n=1 Tax=Synechococcus sp. CCFWC 502 TaxID=2978474 RepID=UPI0026338D9A|nr:hypothetical protein [Synechococcus sp. CCFWC 502]WFN57742.1 hypothetical protein N4320_07650 [Synechococcus sp. CCFWC 502]
MTCKRSLMIKAPRAMRKGLAGAPNPFEKLRGRSDAPAHPKGSDPPTSPKRLSPESFPAEWEEEIIKGELIAFLAAVHVEKLGAAFRLNPADLRTLYTAIEVPRSTALQAVWRSSGSPK